jgi:hypothetical protein
MADTGVNFERLDHCGWALRGLNREQRAIAACHAAPQKSRAPCKENQLLAQLIERYLGEMCQVSSGEFYLVDPCVDLFVDFVECGLEGCIGGAEVGKRGGQSRTQQSVVGAGVRA